MRRSLILLGAVALTLSACNVPVIWMGPTKAASCDVSTAAAAGTTTVAGRATVPGRFYMEATGTASSAETEAERSLADAEVNLGDAQGNAIPGLPTARTDANGNFSVPDIPSSFSYVVIARRTLGQKTVTLKSLIQTRQSSSSTASSSSVTLSAATTLVTEAVTQGRRGIMKEFSVSTYDRAVAIVLSYLQTGNLPDLSDRAGMLAWIEALSRRVPELRSALDLLVIELYGASPIPAPATSASPSASPVPPPSPSASPIPVVSTVQVVTLAGDAGGYKDAEGLSAQFNLPTGVVVGADGALYVVDSLNHAVRRVQLSASGDAGAVSTFAGNGEDGYLNATGTEARFYRPTGIARDAQGNLYVADSGSHRIRRIGTDRSVSLYAGSGLMGTTEGPSLEAAFSSPGGLALDGAGNLYVADTQNHRIRKIAPDGVVSTFAGSTAGFQDAVGPAARFNAPEALAWDPQGFLYVSDTGNDRIRRVSADGTVTTVAGVTTGYADGIGSMARFKSPSGIALFGGKLYVADEGNHRIRSIDLRQPSFPVTTHAGKDVAASTDGPAAEASFRAPAGLAVDAQGRLYVTEPYTHRVRVIR